MRTLTIIAAMLFSVPALGARYVRYECQAAYSYDDVASPHFDGCSAWYSPDIWDAAEAQREAINASLEACHAESGDGICFLEECVLEETDLYSPSWECPTSAG